MSSTIPNNEAPGEVLTSTRQRPSRPAAAVSDRPRTPAQAVRERRYRRLLATADVSAVGVALLLLAAFTSAAPAWPALIVAPAIVVLAKATGLYDRDELLIRRSTLDEVPRLFHSTTLATLCMWLGQSVVFQQPLVPGSGAVLWISLLVTLVVLRWSAREIAARFSPADRCLVIGDDDDATRLRAKVAPGRVEVLGSVTLRSVALDPGTLSALALHFDAHRLVIAPPSSGAHEVTMDVIRQAKATGLRVTLMPGILEVVGSSVAFDELAGLTLLGVKRFGLSRSSRLLKRTFDLVAATVALVVLLPLLIVIAVLVAATSRGPVFFTQTRVGRDGRRFPIIKFRTMVDGADAMRPELAGRNEAVGGLFKIADDPRLTSVGRRLRRTSLDEVPQFLNVLRGEMSIVGPRPLVVTEDEQVIGRDRDRLSLTPGITGPWQIIGPARTPMAEMVRMDYMYVASWSLWNDVKICIRTVRHMLSANGQ